MQKINKLHPDGIGVFWIKRGFAEFRKGLNVNEAYDLIKDTDCTIGMHFRHKSVGEVDKLLTHPFITSLKSPLKLEGRARKLLAHNGTYLHYDEMLLAANIKVNPKEPMSDSRAFAMLYAKNKNIDFFELIDKKTVYQKFLLVDGIKKEFRMLGHFFKEDEIFFSKVDWKYTYTQSTYIDDYWKNEYPDYVPPAVTPINTPPPANHIQINNSQVNQSNNLNKDNQSLIPMSRRDKKREARRLEQKKFWSRFLGVKLSDIKYEEGKDNNPDIIDVKEVEEIDLEKTKDIYQREHEKPPAPFFDNNTKKILGINRDIPPYAGHGAFSDI